jgi:hypothetical protein
MQLQKFHVNRRAKVEDLHSFCPTSEKHCKGSVSSVTLAASKKETPALKPRIAAQEAKSAQVTRAALRLKIDLETRF